MKEMRGMDVNAEVDAEGESFGEEGLDIVIDIEAGIPDVAGALESEV